MSTSAPATADASAAPSPAPKSLVMQIILRRDLMTTHGWGVGPMMAQAAHAAAAVQHLHSADPAMTQYFAGDAWRAMRKTVLEVADESALTGLAGELEAAGIKHHLWVEEPEHFPTALALVPNNRPKKLKKILDAAGAKLWE